MKTLLKSLLFTTTLLGISHAMENAEELKSEFSFSYGTRKKLEANNSLSEWQQKSDTWLTMKKEELLDGFEGKIEKNSITVSTKKSNGKRLLDEIHSTFITFITEFSIKNVDLSTSFPFTWPDMKNVKKLALCNANLQKVPNIIFDLDGLEEIDLSGNKIEEISSDIALKFPLIKKINLSYNNITKLPLIKKWTKWGIEKERVIFYSFNDLKELSIEGNPLSDKTRKKLEDLKKSPKKKNLRIQY